MICMLIKMSNGNYIISGKKYSTSQEAMKVIKSYKDNIHSIEILKDGNLQKVYFPVSGQVRYSYSDSLISNHFVIHCDLYPALGLWLLKLS